MFVNVACENSGSREAQVFLAAGGILGDEQIVDVEAETAGLNFAAGTASRLARSDTVGP